MMAAATEGAENMVNVKLNLNEPPPTAEGNLQYVLLEKDQKPICRVKTSDFPFDVPSVWPISRFIPRDVNMQYDFPYFRLLPEPEDYHETNEWGRFMDFIQKYQKVGITTFPHCTFYIYAAADCRERSHVLVGYETSGNDPEKYNNIDPAKIVHNWCRAAQLDVQRQSKYASQQVGDSGFSHPNRMNALRPKRMDLHRGAANYPSPQESVEDDQENSTPISTKSSVHDIKRNFVSTDPSYLQTLSQTHAAWIFGGIAELVDNSRDSGASRLDISIESLFSKKAEGKIPVMSVIDDGQGMTHDDILRMISFGHKQPLEHDQDQIGRFGIGFKTGAMRLGKDALVLTQSKISRSVALLSQTFNDQKDNLEIPVVTYRKQGNYMEFDLSVQSEATAEYNLKGIREFSPFNEYCIGEKLGFFGETGTGTQIYIWNLDKWGSDYSLEWDSGKAVENTLPHGRGDILIRSRRVRSRPGQISKEVPLDYSLQSYLEVIFMNPRMQIYVQGSLVKTRPLHKSLNKTFTESGCIMGRQLHLTLGRSKSEWERMNCGIFLYWHGRLIEAYKRVGGQRHNADSGRGVIGVIDVTNLMDDGHGNAWVLNSKQGFQDCEAYAELEDWLGFITDEYWNKNFDNLDVKKANERYKPDQDWVQCNSCRKWRTLSKDFNVEDLPKEWFCFMAPYKGKCETPEQQMGHGVIVVGEKRSLHDEGKTKVFHEDAAKNGKSALNDRSKPSFNCFPTKSNRTADDDYVEESSQSSRPALKRLRRGPRRRGPHPRRTRNFQAYTRT